VLVGFWTITLLNFLGVKTSAWVSTLCVLIGTVLPGLLLIILGGHWVFTGKALAIPLTLANVMPDLSYPSNLVFLSGIFLALSGLEANANLAREVKNPQKNYPKAILIAVVMTLFLLILGSIVVALVTPKSDIRLVSGLLDTFNSLFTAYRIWWLLPLIAIFVVLGAAGELNAWAIAGVKGLFVTSEHGALPPYFHKVNKHYAPTRLILFQAVIVSIFAFVFLYLPDVNVSYWVLSVLSAQMYIMMYFLLFVAGLVLRYTKPDVPRAYRIPFRNVGIWVVSLLGMSSCLFAFAMSFYPPKEFKITSVLKYETLLIAGIVISCLIPLIIHAMKKEHWKRKVLVEIRKEIHKSTH